MSNELAVIPISEIQVMANAIARSGLFGVKTPDQALAIMLIAQAEGQHPAIAARDYDVIQGKPAKKSEAMLRDFLKSGGKVQWHDLNNTLADATFSHPSGGEVRISWDMNRATAAGLGGKDNWKKFPRQMLRARVVSEGVRTVCPMATSGMYVPEEVQDFEPAPVVIENTPPAPTVDSITKLTESAKKFASEIELADSENKLHPLLVCNADMMNELSKRLPKWHEKLLTIIGKQRAVNSQNSVDVEL